MMTNSADPDQLASSDKVYTHRLWVLIRTASSNKFPQSRVFFSKIRKTRGPRWPCIANLITDIRVNLITDIRVNWPLGSREEVQY